MMHQEVTIKNVEPTRFALVGFDDVALNTGRTYLVKDILPKNGLVVIWGPPKSGKSFLTIDMILHVVLGWDYRGHRVEQGSVVYIAAEGGGGVTKRLEAFRQEKLGGGIEHFVPFHLLATRLDLVHDRSQLIHDISKQLGQEDPSAVIVDTLNRTFSGSESNDADMTAYIEAADTIRQAFDCTVVLVHHCGWDKSRPRGHSSLLGAVDAQIAVFQDARDNIIALVEHMRDGEDGAEWASTLRQVVVGTDEDGDVITSCIIKPIDNYQPPKKGSKGLSTQQINAFNVLKEAVADAGQIPPANNHIPPNTMAVTMDKWWHCCENGGVTGSGNPDSRRKAFKRAVEALQKADMVGVCDEWAWIV